MFILLLVIINIPIAARPRKPSITSSYTDHVSNGNSVPPKRRTSQSQRKYLLPMQ